MPKMEECFKPHSILHWVFGAGLGLVLTGLFPGLAANATALGIILLIVGFFGEFVWNKGA